MSTDAETRLQAAFALVDAGRWAEAEGALRRIVAEEPGNIHAHRRLFGVLQKLGRWEDALAAIAAGVEANPTAGRLRYFLAITLLEMGRLDEGFLHYEARRAVVPHEFGPPPAETPEWRGEPLGSLVILPEQGFGDAIQFARYARVLHRRGVKVTLVCRWELYRLFQTLGVPVASLGKLYELPRHDAYIYQGSLPRWLRGAPPAEFRIPLGAGGGIGVMARGNPLHGNDARRSLQGADQARLLSLGLDLHPDATRAEDFFVTAQLIARLDLVVTVDTAIAHLAASLGKPCWILLPAEGADWRWMRERTDSPWYPSVRLFRQQPGETWGAVLDRVEQGLGRSGRQASP